MSGTSVTNAPPIFQLRPVWRYTPFQNMRETRYLKKYMLTLQSLKYQSNVFTDRIKHSSLFGVSLLYFQRCFLCGSTKRSISTICQSAEYILELYIGIQIRTIQLLIFTEKFLPLLGFEPGTSPVPSRYATN